MTFSKKLTLLRKKAGLSQDQLAEMLDVSRQSVSKWEGQQTMPETAKAIAMANIFNVSLDVLLRDEFDLEDSAAVNCAVHMESSAPVTPADELPSKERPHRRKLLICVLGGVALLLSAALLVGVLSFQGRDSSAPSSSVSTSQPPEQGLTSQAGREQTGNQRKLSHYIRRLMMHIKAQNDSKEDPGYAQTP